MSATIQSAYRNVKEAMSILDGVQLTSWHGDEEDNTDYIGVIMKAKSAVDNAKRELEDYMKEMGIDTSNWWIKLPIENEKYD